jgi:phage terminase large subunit-like protein
VSTSLASILASEPDFSRQRLLESLSEAEAEALLYDWRFWARPSQIEPPGDWRFWFFKAGRGAGKTRSAAEWVIEQVRSSPTPIRIALVGKTPADARDVMVNGDAGIIQRSPPWFCPVYHSSKRLVLWPNGSTATLYSSYQYDTLRGPAHHIAWADEIASWRYPDATFSNLDFGLRLGENPRCVISSTPRPIRLVKDLIARDGKDVVVTGGSTYDNRANLPKAFLDAIIRRYEGTPLGEQEIHARVIGDTPGALWRRAMIDATRVVRHPDLVRVVVGVDPQGTKSADGEEATHETGIICAGLGEDGHGYVFDDASIDDLPDKWAAAVVACFNRFGADLVCGEVNFGGQMVEWTIRTVQPLIPFKPVVASRGKYIRAEPISALYAQGRVHHVGMFGGLEDEMCSYVSRPGARSPNRLDALVIGLTELMLEGRAPGDLGLSL